MSLIRLKKLAEPTGHTVAQLIANGWADHIDLARLDSKLENPAPVRRPTAHSKALDKALASRSRPPKTRRAKI